MKFTENYIRTRELLIQHFQSHPDMQPADFFKLLYQSAYGCEHLASDRERVTEYIKQELLHCNTEMQPPTEMLDGSYCRVGLSYIKKGLSADTLGRIFCLSAKKEPGAGSELEEKLSALKSLVAEGSLPFSFETFQSELDEWAARGYPAIHHSDAYRSKYKPCYRVVAERFVPFLPLFAEIDKHLEKGSVRLAVEGGSASGKTTLSALLNEVYGCTVFHTDDFFLRAEQRTPERYNETGGNMDRERLEAEVLIPLSRGDEIAYMRFDCCEMKLLPAEKIKQQRLTVVEGAYSMHPELSKYYDLSVFLDISPDLQRERILKRNSPAMAERFFEEWIPLENRYFNGTDAKNRCTLCIQVQNR